MILESCCCCKKIDTYRKNASGLPWCIICEIPIKKSVPKIIVHPHVMDQEKKLVSFSEKMS